MGDRVSIQFVNPDESEWNQKSVVLFSHWGGRGFVDEANAYVAELKKEIAADSRLSYGPLGRLEPQTVMVDFIRVVTTARGRIDGDLYLGATERDGDNSDNGHHQIILNGAVRVVAR